MVGEVNPYYYEVALHTHWYGYRKLDSTKHWKACGKTGTLIYYWWGGKIMQSLGPFLKLLNTELLYEQQFYSVLILEQWKCISYTGQCANVRSNIFHSNPQMETWENRMWSIPIVECYWPIWKNGVLIHDTTICLNLENTAVSERKQSQKSTELIISLCEISKEGNSIKTECSLVDAWHWRCEWKAT